MHFGQAVHQALQGGPTAWEKPLYSRLALVILLGQFSRNVFRGTAQAFDGDARARQLTLQTLAQQEDRQLLWVGRVFIYKPLIHAEDLTQQNKCVTCFAQIMADAPAALKPKLQGNVDFAVQHNDIITRLSRFPHRNAVPGRISTAEEDNFLRTGPRFDQ